MSDPRTDQAIADLKRRLANAERQLRQIPSRWVAPANVYVPTIKTAMGTNGNLIDITFDDPVPWGTVFDLAISTNYGINGFVSAHHHHAKLSLSETGKLTQNWISTSISWAYNATAYGGTKGRETVYNYNYMSSYGYTTTTDLSAASFDVPGTSSIEKIELYWTPADSFARTGSAYAILTW